MNNHTSTAHPSPVVMVAFFSALASVGIAALVFCLNDTLSAFAMWGAAAMVAAPSAMGLGIAKLLTSERLRSGGQ